MTFTLRPYQRAAIDGLYSYWSEHRGDHPLIVAPTGSGKTFMIAQVIKDAMSYPDTRVLLLTHVRELLEQDARGLLKLYPEADWGYYSASLKQKRLDRPITFAGIQSIWRRAHDMLPPPDLVLVDECFDGETEILTENGFVRFDELADERTAAVDTNFNVTFEQPEKICRPSPASPMRTIFSDRTFDLHVTAQHDMVVKSHGKQWGLISVDDVTSADYVKMATAGFGGGHEYTLSAQEKLSIAFQADGSLHHANKNGTAILAFSFSKQRKIDAFLALMSEGEFQFKLLNIRQAKGNVRERKRFMVYVDSPITKNVASYFTLDAMSCEKAKSIIEYMNIWDGNVASKDCYLFTTTDRRAANFYQAVCALSGYRTVLREVADNRSTTFNNVFRLFITKKQFVSTQSWKPKPSLYSGPVYCVRVSTGAIIIRRGGKTLVVGNCHLVPKDTTTRYGKFLADLKQCNPAVKVVGFTATPYRLGSGYLHKGPGALFDGIAHDISISMLMEQGYLAPVVSKGGLRQIDLSDVHKRGGEFIESELAHAASDPELVRATVAEIVRLGHDRKSWLIFASGINHAEMLRDQFVAHGIDARVLTGETATGERDATIGAFRRGELRCLININVLTNGFDVERIDLVALVRATASTGLYVQMIGRGCRMWPGKTNILCLDYGSNVERHGFIDRVKPNIGSGTGEGTAPVRKCPECQTMNHAAALICIECGYQFPAPALNHGANAYAGAMLSSQAPIEWADVTGVRYQRWKKEGKPDSVCVAYRIGLLEVREWLCPDHGGYAAEKYITRCRVLGARARTTDAAMDECLTWVRPRRIRIRKNGKYTEIVQLDYAGGTDVAAEVNERTRAYG